MWKDQHLTTSHNMQRSYVSGKYSKQNMCITSKILNSELPHFRIADSTVIILLKVTVMEV